VIVFQLQSGNRGPVAPVIKLLFEEPLLTAANQDIALLRLTLPPGTVAEGGAHANPGIVYVLEGSIEGPSKIYLSC
jgi:hypothetical protein